MKRTIFKFIVMISFFVAPAMAEEAASLAPEQDAGPIQQAAPKKQFNIYTDKFDLTNHYIPSGWMGDYGDLAMNDESKENPHSGRMCIKITYSAEGAQGAGWVGIYWQNPANNWGDRMGGYDLSPYKALTFWARGEKGDEVITEFKIGGISGTYSDTDSTGIGPITLTKEWKEYKLDLTGLDLSYISGGFAFSASANDNPKGFTMYLDEIKFEE